MKPRPALPALAWLSALAFVLSTGCTRVPPYRQAVEAESPIRFSQWRAHLYPELTPEEWRWFDLSMQEFKFQVMLAGKVSGSEAIDAAVREKVHGRALADVVREGLQAHHVRRTAERDELEAALKINASRKIRPTDTDMLRDMAAHQEILRRKLAKLNEELAALDVARAQFEAKAKGS